MPRLHTIGSPESQIARQSIPSRPSRSNQAVPMTKREITAADAPKIAMAGAALLLVLIGARLAVGRVQDNQERTRTIMHINLEAGRGPDADTSEVPETQPGEGDANFVW